MSPFQQGTETATNVKGRVTPQAQECIKKLRNELKTKLSDDLHTPTILNAALQEALKLMNSCLTTLKVGTLLSLLTSASDWCDITGLFHYLFIFPEKAAKATTLICSLFPNRAPERSEGSIENSWLARWFNMC